MKGALRTTIDLFLLITYVGVFNLCFYGQFVEGWIPGHCRRLYYWSTAAFLTLLLIDELCKFEHNTHYQVNKIGQCTVIINFTLFALMLHGVFTNEIFYLFLLDGSIFAISGMILFSGIRHNVFTNE